jgi:GTP pyrophosphokinase
LPGDDVVGFVTRGRGLVIHRRDCTQVQETREPERWVDLEWGPEESERHVSQIAVIALDEPGLLTNLLNVITHLGVNLAGARRERHSDGTAELRLELEFRDARHLSHVLESLERQKEVLSVRRVSQ